MHTSPAVFAWCNTLLESYVLSESEKHLLTTCRPPPHASLQIEFLAPKDAQRSEMYTKQFFQTIIVWLFLEGGWFCILLSRTGPNIVSCKILNLHYISLNLPVLAGVCDVYLIIVSYAVFCMPVYWLNEIIAS